MAGYDYPRSAINSVWQGKLLVHEHNWGGHNGIISDAVKLARARDSHRVADELLSGSLDVLISHIRCRDKGIPLVVFNELSWPRTDVVDYVLSVDKTGSFSNHGNRVVRCVLMMPPPDTDEMVPNCGTRPTMQMPRRAGPKTRRSFRTTSRHLNQGTATSGGCNCLMVQSQQVRRQGGFSGFQLS
jgi:hypothetical protein